MRWTFPEVKLNTRSTSLQWNKTTGIDSNSWPAKWEFYMNTSGNITGNKLRLWNKRSLEILFQHSRFSFWILVVPSLNQAPLFVVAAVSFSFKDWSFGRSGSNIDSCSFILAWNSDHILVQFFFQKYILQVSSKHESE